VTQKIAKSCDFPGFAHDGIRQIAPYVPGRPLEEVAERYGLDLGRVIKLASNECPLGCSRDVRKTIAELVDTVHLYPDGDGSALKKNLSEKLDVPSSAITLGNGSNEILELAARVFAGPGRDIIYSQYAFAVYPIISQVVGANGVEVPASRWGHDLSAMAQAVTDDTRLLFIANPNNPTGTWLGRDDLFAFLSALPKHVVVVLDEAYFEFADHENAQFPDSIRWLETFAQLIITRTFSKAYGLAGLRIGYSISNPQIADLFNRVRQPFNINALAQAAACAALQDQGHVREACRVNALGKQQLQQAFEQMKLSYIPSLGNFISVAVGDGSAVFESLLSKGVIVRPMAGYRMPEYIRVSIGTELENRTFLGALREALR